jgi:RNA polymerase sigma-70 factor (ECF subfamily)
VEHSDVDLVRSASRGDELAIGTLLERHLPGVLAYVRSNAGERLLAREASLDIVQSACREVLQDLSRYDYKDEAGFRHWLYLSAERKILERARHHGREKRGGGRDPVPLSAVESELLQRSYAGLGSPSQGAIAREELERMEAALRGLSTEHREVILLARIVGLSHAAIAEKLGKSERAVTSLLHRALVELGTALGTDRSR